MEKTKRSIKSLIATIDIAIVALDIAYIFCNKAVPWVISNIASIHRNIKGLSRTT